MADYSIWVVEYARVNEFAEGILLQGRWNTPTKIAPYCYAVLKGEGHIAVVDCGFDNVELGAELGRSYGVSDWQAPDVVLNRIGVDPAAVDTMILTHNHFDHAGGVEFFPNAHVYIQEREVSRYLWAKGLPDRLQWLTTATDPDLVLWLVNRMKSGKLTLLNEETRGPPGRSRHPRPRHAHRRLAVRHDRERARRKVADGRGQLLRPRELLRRRGRRPIHPDRPRVR